MIASWWWWWLMKEEGKVPWKDFEGLIWFGKMCRKNFFSVFWGEFGVNLEHLERKR